jgi:hypothetical protein
MAWVQSPLSPFLISLGLILRSLLRLSEAERMKNGKPIHRCLCLRGKDRGWRGAMDFLGSRGKKVEGRYACRGGLSVHFQIILGRRPHQSAWFTCANLSAMRNAHYIETFLGGIYSSTTQIKDRNGATLCNSRPSSPAPFQSRKDKRAQT